MSTRHMTLALGTAAGAILAAGLIPLATSPVAHAICAPDDSLGCDTDFIFNFDNLGKLFGFTDLEAADPDNNFEAMVFHMGPITDVLTSGNDPSDALAGFGITLPDTTGVGVAGETVNTFVDSMNPALDSTTVIPFTDPLAQLWDFLVANAFFGF